MLSYSITAILMMDDACYQRASAYIIKEHFVKNLVSAKVEHTPQIPFRSYHYVMETPNPFKT